jgi:hypothetical protein
MADFQPTKLQLERLIEAFDHVKAENDPLITDPHANAFVSTRVYRQTIRKRWCLVVGGKGSGKTALLLGFQLLEKRRFLSIVNIEADKFPLEALFNFFYASVLHSQKKLKDELPQGTDLPDFVDPVKISEYAWGNSMKYCAIQSAAQELLNRSSEFSINESEVKTLKKACRRVARLLGERSSASQLLKPTEAVYALLIYFFHTVQEVIDKTVNHKTESLAVLLASITLQLGRHWRATLDKPMAQAADIIKAVLQRHSIRTLVTLDKFDDYYDNFSRKYTRDPSPASRHAFLSAVLEGLVLSTRRLSEDGQFDWISGLVTIPRDKFLELHLRERVSLEEEEGVWLRWTPRELYEYASRRIAHALELGTIDGAWEHLFPFEVTNGRVKEVKENSFLYLVRHSRWRPRELQLYIKRVLQMMDDTRRPAGEIMFRKAVKMQSEDTIREEFREEYSVEYPGLAATLRKLETVGLKSVMPYEDVCSALSKASLFDESRSVDELMLRLFHLGVVGVRSILQGPRNTHADATIMQNHQHVAYRYYYNTAHTEALSQGSTVVFHPMFFGYLNILHDQKYVVNQLTWDMFPTEEE